MALVLVQWIDQVKAGRALSPDQVGAVVDLLVHESVPVDEKAGFLSALAAKGETVDEIAAFAQALREKSIPPLIDPATRRQPILDVCGTGGDRMNTFNISTAVALIAAAAGITVAKHGNRAITSQCGSADVLDALGIRTDLTPAEAGSWLREHHFAFLFAPLYHPAFRHIAPARRLCAEQGQRTIFNFLGPLLNPVRPTAQLIGVPRAELCDPLARVLKSLGVRSGMVVCSKVDSGYLDELCPFGENRIAVFKQDEPVHTQTVSLDNIERQPATVAHLAGQDRHTNAQIIQGILAGHDRGPRREAVQLNAAAALMLAQRAETMRAGWDLAGTLIDNGQAANLLQKLVAVSGRRAPDGRTGPPPQPGTKPEEKPDL
jgi:anthranilate phosphoribosyltransferase